MRRAASLPANLPGNPNYRKVNPADAPILILALTSDSMTLPRMYDAADSILAQKLAQVEGVGQVFVGGGAKPAVRAEVNPTLLNKLGVGLDTVRTALGTANANRPKGEIAAAGECLDSSTPTIRSLPPTNTAADRRLQQRRARCGCSDVGRRAGFRGRHPQHRAVQRQARGPDHHLPPARRQHYRNRGPRARAAAAAAGLDSRRRSS